MKLITDLDILELILIKNKSQEEAEAKYTVLYYQYGNTDINIKSLLADENIFAIFRNVIVETKKFIDKREKNELLDMINDLGIESKKYENIRNAANKERLSCTDDICYGKTIYSAIIATIAKEIFDLRINIINKNLKEIDKPAGIEVVDNPIGPLEFVGLKQESEAIPVKKDTTSHFKQYVYTILVLFLIILLLTVVLYIVNVVINIIIYLILSRTNKHMVSFWYVFAGPLGLYYFV